MTGQSTPLTADAEEFGRSFGETWAEARAPVEELAEGIVEAAFSNFDFGASGASEEVMDRMIDHAMLACIARKNSTTNLSEGS